jgi:hypothetical protein
VDQPGQAPSSWDEFGIKTRIFYDDSEGKQRRHGMRTLRLHYHEGFSLSGLVATLKKPKARVGVGSYAPAEVREQNARMRTLRQEQQDRFEHAAAMHRLEMGSLTPHRSREVADGLEAAGMSHLV